MPKFAPNRPKPLETSMTTPRCASLFAVVLGCALATSVQAQPATGKPKIVVGDTWEFSRTVTPPGRTEPTTRKVTEVLGEDRLRTAGTMGTTAEFDSAMNWMRDGNPDQRHVLVAFPLAVGKEWTVARKFANPDLTETGKARVAAIEQVSVPAGKFQCYRIEAEALMVGKVRPQNPEVKVTGDYTEARTWKRWYCPQVKWIAREVLETRYFHPNAAASNTTLETLELVRFTPGK